MNAARQAGVFGVWPNEGRSGLLYVANHPLGVGAVCLPQRSMELPNVVSVPSWGATEVNASIAAAPAAVSRRFPDGFC